MSDAEEDRIEFLEKLGLTVVQAKIYIANIDTGPATAKQISKVAKVAREDVYRVMPSLQTLGLTKNESLNQPYLKQYRKRCRKLSDQPQETRN